jgi:hypothetical protein
LKKVRIKKEQEEGRGRRRGRGMRNEENKERRMSKTRGGWRKEKTHLLKFRVRTNGEMEFGIESDLTECNHSSCGITVLLE